MKPLLLTLFLSLLLVQLGITQIGRVGINTISPAAMLHVNDSSVVFTGPSTLPVNPGAPPVSGAGTRFMWYPDKAAFRVGYVNGIQWNKDNIGQHSVALGENAIANGQNSTAIGLSTSASETRSTALGYGADATGYESTSIGRSTTASGVRSFAMGALTSASGEGSTAMGFETEAIGSYSTAIGYNTNAVGTRSTSMGSFTTATGIASVSTGSLTSAYGNYSFTSGINTNANSYCSAAFGRFNNTDYLSSNLWEETDPLFMIGNGGTEATRSNAFTVLKNGNVGIGVHNPGFLLNFPNALGDKISLSGNSGAHFGFGIQTSLLQIHTDNNSGDIAFGYGSSSSFTETMRIKGNGRVGIGTSSPGFPLNFSNTLGDKISLWGNSGVHYGIGIQSNAFQIHTDDVGSDVVFGYGTSSALTETMRIKGNGNVGIGTTTPEFKLDVSARMRLRSGGAAGTSPGIWFNEIDNSGVASFFGMFNDDHIGIYSGLVGVWFYRMNMLNGNLGLGVTPTEKLHVLGNGLFTGTVTASCGVLVCSDVRYKKNILPLTNVLSGIQSLNGVYYHWDKETFPEIPFNDERQIGIIAQELEKVFPEVVHTDASGYKTVDYSRLSPVLLEAIKEQQVEIEALKNNLDQQSIINEQLQHQIEILLFEIQGLQLQMKGLSKPQISQMVAN